MEDAQMTDVPKDQDLIKLISLLIETYDTKIIDHYPKELQNALYEEAEKGYLEPFAETTINKKVLMELINNHNPKNGFQKPSPDFIGGPKTLTLHWSSELNKMIYIFGEDHSNKMDCDEKFPNKETWNSPKKMNIADFFIKLSNTTDVFIDFLIEVPVYKQKTKQYDFDVLSVSGDTNLGKIVENFKDCIEYDKRNNHKCRLSRVHYIDTRFKYNSPTISEYEITTHFVIVCKSIINTEKLTISEKVKKLKEIMSDEIISTFIQNITNKNPKNVKEFWKNQITDNPYIMKELKRVNKSIKLILSRFIFQEMITTANKYIHYILESPGSTDEDFINYVSGICIYIAQVDKFTVDAYILARIFKHFNLTKPAYEGAIIGDQPTQTHNIIIYAGDLHSVTCRKFLRFLGFKIWKTSTQNTATNCLDLREFPKPFFSYDHIRDKGIFKADINSFVLTITEVDPYGLENVKKPGRKHLVFKDKNRHKNPFAVKKTK